MTPGAAGTASYHYRGETVAQDETDVAARLNERTQIVAFLRRYAGKADLSERESLIVRDSAARIEGEDYRNAFPVTLRAATLRGEAGR